MKIDHFTKQRFACDGGQDTDAYTDERKTTDAWQPPTFLLESDWIRDET